MGEKPPLVKRLPATTTVTILPVSEKCSFFLVSFLKLKKHAHICTGWKAEEPVWEFLQVKIHQAHSVCQRRGSCSRTVVSVPLFFSSIQH